MITCRGLGREMKHQIWKQSHIGDEYHPEYPLEEILLVEGLTYEQSVVLCKELNKHFGFKVGQDEYICVDENDVVVYSVLETITLD